ncbi:TonB-dependent receptor [Sphingomonas kyeonggiensis]|uniref:TonB-dependent receptor n=1 Tax=Sphingomonas kyeonggiensis TaxID=1268553 RepID=A0A7W6JYF1_9SPHN|nr:TonB-dependent receptor [Sphingomonas kyeonggiensis]MBB4100742.1 TonB-dependent receptor [Sphingomonas kyeonggiensis]
MKGARAFYRFGAVVAITTTFPAGAHDVASRRVPFAIPAGPLAPALTAFSKASGVQVLADPAVLRGLETRGVRGRMSPIQALEILLRGTGLGFRRRDETILIFKLDMPARATAQIRTHPARSVPSSDDATTQAEPSGKIVVIGQRIADRRAIAIKRSARNIVDAISSDEVRRLPDSTVVDAMRRIPGVSVVPIADNEHPRDVPIAPVIRGLTQAYNNVTINGLPVASTGIPDAGSNSAVRGARLDLLPASLVSRLLVMKTFTPEYDPNAIGAAIDLQTRSAFDNAGRAFLSLEAGLATPSERGQVQAQGRFGAHLSATASRTFGSDGQFGLVVSANYQRLENNSNVHATSDSSFLVFYDDAGRQRRDGTLGNGIPVPRQDKYWYNGSDRQHLGGTIRAEADLDTLRLSALVADYRYRDGYTRNEIAIDPDQAWVLDQTRTSGRFDTASIQVGYRGGVTHSETRVLQLDADWQPTSRDALSLRVGLSRATMRERYKMVKFTAGQDRVNGIFGVPALGFRYDSMPLQFSFNVPEKAYQDLSLYTADYWRRRGRQATAGIGNIRADWRRDMADGEEGLGFAAGIAWTRSTYAYGYQSLAFGTLNRSLTLDDVGYVSNAALPFNQNRLRLIVIDPARAWRMFDANQASISITDGVENDHQDDFDHRESVLSGYTMVRFQQGPVELLAGSRLERTETSTQGYLSVDDAWSTIGSGSDYFQLLPSLLANYRPLHALKLRAGYSRTIGRPSYEAYSPRSSIEFDTGSAVGDPDAPGVKVAMGNPHIRPRISDNFDLSGEWTLPKRFDGMLSAALFHKAIQDEIFDAITRGYAHDGVYYRNATVVRPANASGAHISGLELSAMVGSLGAISPVLKNIGFSANWTLLRGAVTVPMTSGVTRKLGRLVGQPDEIRNLAIFYNRGGFELRAAMNWTGKALRSIAPDTVWQDVYWAPRTQFDVQGRYHVGRNFSAILDLANITRTRVTSVTGPGARWLKDSYSVPGVVRLSLNWGFGQ